MDLNKIDISKELEVQIKKDTERDKYLKTLCATPDFKKYVLEPLKTSINDVKSVEHIEIGRPHDEVIAILSGQKIAHDYLQRVFSFIYIEE